MDSRKEEEQAVRELWQKRIKDGESHPGGVKAYCLEAQIVTSRFYYWRNKLKPKALAQAPDSPVGSFIIAEVSG